MAHELKTTPGWAIPEQQARLEQLMLSLLDEAVGEADPDLMLSIRTVRLAVIAGKLDEPTAAQIFSNAGKLVALKQEGKIPTDEEIEIQARRTLGLWKQ